MYSRSGDIYKSGHTIHFIENGTEICIIQKMLNYNDSKTTLMYKNSSKKSINKVES